WLFLSGSCARHALGILFVVKHLREFRKEIDPQAPHLFSAAYNPLIVIDRELWFQSGTRLSHVVWFLKNVYVYPGKVLHAAYLPHRSADSGNHRQISHLGSIHKAECAGVLSRGGFVSLYKFAGRLKWRSLGDFLLRKACGSHGFHVN